MDDSDMEIERKDRYEIASNEDMDTDCNQNISLDTSASLVSSEVTQEEDDDDEGVAEDDVTLGNSRELESDLEEEGGKDSKNYCKDSACSSSSSSSSTSDDGATRDRKRFRPTLAAAAEVVKYIKTQVVPYKPDGNPRNRPERRLRIARRQIKACRPSVDSQCSKHSGDSGRLSEVSSGASSGNRSGSQTYRISGRFERPGDTDEEAEAKNLMEHKRCDHCVIDDRKTRILLNIFGSQLRFRNQERASRMSSTTTPVHSGDSDLGHSEVASECPPEEDEGYSNGESERRIEEEEKSAKTDEGGVEEEEEEGEEDPESEEAVDYDEKNDYNDYAYNISSFDDSDGD